MGYTRSSFSREECTGSTSIPETVRPCHFVFCAIFSCCFSSRKLLLSAISCLIASTTAVLADGEGAMKVCTTLFDRVNEKLRSETGVSE